MGFLTRAVALMRRDKRAYIAERSDAVLRRVLFDIGPDRLLKGNMVLDRDYRIHFYSTVPALIHSSSLIVVALADLEEAHALSHLAHAHPLDSYEVVLQRQCLVDSILRAMQSRAPKLRQSAPEPADSGMATQA